MPDLLTHALVGFVVGTALSWRDDRVTGPFVTLVMVGALSPDLNRIELLVPDPTVETLVGIPWTWVPLHRLGGTVLVVTVAALLVDRRHRRLAVGLLAAGATSHYALDFLLYKPSGLTSPLLWPFTVHRFAVEGIYVSSDRWPAVVAGVAAICVWLIDRRLTLKSRTANRDG
ncbi:metal-dependent hydrolase [Natronomonas salina]|uniref:metal-dependent hydrolase n=1 Tax=Natronomonas salina TaxID=1710540 RepID=UPI0015B652E3|nr:metal-dependent hydrolase [Natronomonas salina]QLD88830.1 metal-dependent hydrolase [Natronomonas salina]